MSRLREIAERLRADRRRARGRGRADEARRRAGRRGGRALRGGGRGDQPPRPRSGERRVSAAPALDVPRGPARHSSTPPSPTSASPPPRRPPASRRRCATRCWPAASGSARSSPSPPPAPSAPTPERFLPVACAIELIHTYSLIHDDLPAMDDDDLRRGMPTSHKRFGEDVAILAGDGLFAEAVRLFCEQPGDPARVLAALRELAAATGVDGMVGGQYVDVIGGRARRRRPARAARAEDRPPDRRQRRRRADPRGTRRT